MTRPYTTTVWLYLVDEAAETDEEVEVTVEFSVSQGYPGSYWQPPEPAEIGEIVLVTVKGERWPLGGDHAWIGDLIVQRVFDEHYEELVEASIEQDHPDPDDARDARIDRELMGWDD